MSCASDYRKGCRCDACRASHAVRMRDLRLKRVQRGATPAEHGASGYNNYKCRCDVCTADHIEKCRKTSEAARERAARRGRTGEPPPEHGVRGYTYYGCRCPVCMEAAQQDRAEKYGSKDQTQTRARRRNYKKTVQNVTLEKAARYGYQWTGPELELVARKELSLQEIALLLGRTFSAVATKRAQLSKEIPAPTWLAGRRSRLH